MNLLHSFRLLALLMTCLLLSCGPKPDPATAPPSRVGELGSLEITARLVEIPEGAIFKRDLYDYATVLKYEVEQVHRGTLEARTIFVAHYNPVKARSEAADARVPLVGGSLERFAAGQRHRLVLDGTLEEQFMGGVVNKYFGQTDGPVYWAVWTDLIE